MLKGLLAALLGGLLLSGWNYVSWEVLGFHQPVLTPTAHENLVFEALDANLEESGAYFLPRRPNGQTILADWRGSSALGKIWPFMVELFERGFRIVPRPEVMNFTPNTFCPSLGGVSVQREALEWLIGLLWFSRGS